MLHTLKHMCKAQNMLHTSRHMVVSYIDTDYTLSNYDFSFTLPADIECKDKMIELIKNEITLQSWPKLIAHMKTANRFNDCVMRELPQKDLEGVGQLSADIVLSKFPTCDEIEKEYTRVQKEHELSRKQSSPHINCCGGVSYVRYASPPK